MEARKPIITLEIGHCVKNTEDKIGRKHKIKDSQRNASNWITVEMIDEIRYRK